MNKLVFIINNVVCNKKIQYLNIGFERKVLEMTKLENANLFHCYVSGDIFKIATATKVQEFDFSHFNDDKKIIKYIEEAIIILKNNLPSYRMLLIWLLNFS